MMDIMISLHDGCYTHYSLVRSYVVHLREMASSLLSVYAYHGGPIGHPQALHVLVVVGMDDIHHLCNVG